MNAMSRPDTKPRRPCSGPIRGLRVVGALLAFVVGSPWGCASSPDPTFYALYSEAGPQVDARPLHVEVRRPGMPGYLDRPQVVSRLESGRLALSGGERWGAPLEEMIGLTLAENLMRRLPQATVAVEGSAISADPDVLVEVSFQRFEPTASGAVVLWAQVALHFPDDSPRTCVTRHQLTQEPRGGGTEAVVRAMSALLAELSDAVAHDVAEGARALPESQALGRAPCQLWEASGRGGG